MFVAVSEKDRGDKNVTEIAIPATPQLKITKERKGGEGVTPLEGVGNGVPTHELRTIMLIRGMQIVGYSIASSTWSFIFLE